MTSNCPQMSKKCFELQLFMKSKVVEGFQGFQDFKFKGKSPWKMACWCWIFPNKALKKCLFCKNCTIFHEFCDFSWIVWLDAIWGQFWEIAQYISEGLFTLCKHRWLILLWHFILCQVPVIIWHVLYTCSWLLILFNNRVWFSYFSSCKSNVFVSQLVMACSHENGGTREGEVPHLPVVKKYLSSHATPEKQGEVQNTIMQSLSMHINKELMFVFFVYSNEAAFHFNVVVVGKTSVWFNCLAWLSNSFAWSVTSTVNFISVSGVLVV